MKLNNLVIIGNNIESYISALYFNGTLPNVNITIIKTKNTVNQSVLTCKYDKKFFDHCGISIEDLFRFCGANVIYGNKFNHWKKGKDFYHPISYNKIDIDKIVWPEKTEEEAELEEIDANTEKEKFSKNLSGSFYNKIFNEESFIEFCNIYPTDDNVLYDINMEEFSHLGLGLNIDYEQCLEFLLKKCAKNQSINIVEDNDFRVEFNGFAYITKIFCNNVTLDCDFVFDCSGAEKRVVKLTPDYEFWHLSFLSENKIVETVSATEYTAWNTLTPMLYGYSISRSLQSKTVNSYVISDFGEQDTLAAELEKTEKKYNPLQEISIENGYIDKPWNKNLLCFGESQFCLQTLNHFNFNFTCNQIALFTSLCEESIEDITEFIVLDDETLLMKEIQFNEQVCNGIRELADFTFLHFFVDNDISVYWELHKENFNRDLSLDELAGQVGSGGETMTLKTLLWSQQPIIYTTENSLIPLNEIDFLFLFEGLGILNKTARRNALENNKIINFCSDENFDAIKQFLHNKKQNLLNKVILNKDFIIKNELSVDLQKN
tara:strand:- start:14881 stop:16521 length:1641 start_codon:yes stop_codon:yes gene_type:complete